MAQPASLESILQTEKPPKPYPGLRPFEKSEASIFFGREPMTRDVVRRLFRNHLVAVHGDSGSGKSSLILAGVLPWLEREIERAGGRWRTCSMRPEGSPLARCVAAIGKLIDAERSLEVSRILTLGCSAPLPLAELLACEDANNVCILFDQFEELFEHAKEDNGTEARLVTAFLVGLAEQKPKGLHAILTMRSDYLGRCAQYEGFAETVNQTQYLVPRMERPALLRAIMEPAKLYGGSVAPELADRLIADAGESQDQLPLIQHGLMRLWQLKTDKKELTLDNYGTGDADHDLKALLSAHANEVFDNATANNEANRRIIELVFRALSGRTPEGAAIRRHSSFKQLCEITEAPPNKLQAILKLFRDDDASLLRPYGTSDLTDDDTVDVSHEAFIRSWSKFTEPQHGFLDREAEDSLIWSSLRLAAEEFRKSPSNVLFAATAFSRQEWIKSHNEVWTRRYGGDYETVCTLIEKSCAVALQNEEKERAAAASSLRNETMALAAISQVAVQEDLPREAVKLALAAWPREGDTERPKLRQTVSALNKALPKMEELLRFEGHSGSVLAAAHSRDGTRVVTGSADNTARIWDALSGEALKVLRDHKGAIYAAAFSPDGAQIATGCLDNFARLWDAATGTLVAKLEGHDSPIVGIAFSPDGTQLVTASRDSHARIWEVSTKRMLMVLKGHDSAILAADFSPNGTSIVTGSQDQTARLWNTATGEVTMTLAGHGNAVSAVAFSPDGKRIVTGSQDKTARLWDIANGNVIKVFSGHSDVVNAVGFSPDGTCIVTGSKDGTTRIWSVAVASVVKIFKAHVSNGDAIAKNKSRDNILAASFSPNGKRVLTGSSDCTARVWNAACATVVNVFEGHQSAVYSVAISPDGTRVATGSYDQTARLWDAASAKLIKIFEGHNGSVQSIAFSPDGASIVTVSSDNTARVWDANTARIIRTLKDHSSSISVAALSLDGRRIVVGSYDKTVHIWDIATGSKIQSLTDHSDAILAVTFSPDGTRIVTGSRDTTARLWDVVAGKVIRVFKNSDSVIHAATFSPDGQHVATGSSDGTVCLWDVSSDTLTKAFFGHSGIVTALAFSPDGTRILTGSRDNTARLWDVATGAMIAAPASHPGAILATTFSTDGVRFATASEDQTVRLWDISLLEKGNAFQIACQRLGQNTDLKDAEARYDLNSLPPICGEFTPLPVQLHELL